MNQLSKSRSPYLLQHAQNPVHWQMWNNETLQKAKQEDKPILVSIGYSACHWCHVMEHESFENEAVAKVMNEYFFCIKVDREERPDVDAIYMEAVQMMGVSGGWPLNVFLTADAKPFWGGTYFPANQWVDIVQQIGKAYQNQRGEVEESANKVTKVLSISALERYNLKDVLVQASTLELDTILEKAFESFEKHFDTEFGGVGQAPKFPMPSYYLFLLRYYDYLNKKNITNPIKIKVLSQVHLTLNKMAQGGMYDQIGGGFARYSVDREWFAPHFEKMLYDNAQLLSLYAEAYTITENSESDYNQRQVYKEIIEQTTEFLTRELQDKSNTNNGFYSALDADSEGKEGKFYTWTIDEIEHIFANHTFKNSENQDEDLQLFKKYYSVTSIGNWESPHATEGANILYRKDTDEEFAKENEIQLGVLKSKVKEWQNHFLEVRKNKVRPSLDDKILTSWNALLIKGFCNVYSSLNAASNDEKENAKYLDLALQTAEFIENNLFDKENTSKLYHTFKNGTAEIDGFLEDYALLIESYIALYQICFDEKWLLRADELTKYVFTNFYDKEERLFYFSDQLGSEKLVAQKKEIFDNVISSSNSVMATNLYFLGILLENNLYKETSKEMLGKVASLIAAEPRHVSNWASLFTYFLTPTPEIAIVGEKYKETVKEISAFYIPNKIIVAVKNEEEGQKSALPLLEMRPTLNNKTTIYVCKNKTCQLPVNSVTEALNQI
ncbi:thioredoxin domain-containing protein [Bernardetia sp. OM2101]|uniref:thioredoxin domain-containing protein n=1 Tax=Bernardetia sp. OM2101 TaxID=3344876 RepID=UPI0035CF86F1